MMPDTDTFEAMRSRPVPPIVVRAAEPPFVFVPAPELLAWAHANIIGDGPLCNEDHDHLLSATLAFLWTNVPYTKQGRRIVGTCEMPNVQGNRCLKSRMEQQLEEWFDAVPDFLITIDATYAFDVDDASFCALIEHELYHAGYQVDEYGAPVFSVEGRIRLAMRAHDVEEHVGVVRRYGVGAASSGVAALVDAASQSPTVARASIASACGACVRV
jgi:hypothetical protein